MEQASNATPWFGQRNLLAGVPTAATLPREADIYLLVLCKQHPEMLPPEALMYLAVRFFGNCVGKSEHA